MVVVVVMIVVVVVVVVVVVAELVVVSSSNSGNFSENNEFIQTDQYNFTFGINTESWRKLNCLSIQRQIFQTMVKRVFRIQQVLYLWKHVGYMSTDAV